MNRQLLEEAYTILDGIPADRFDLDSIARGVFERITPHNCETLACGIGWLGMHPKFRKLGLVVDNRGELYYKSVWRLKCAYGEVAADLFSITKKQALGLFRPAGRASRRKDKETLLRRFKTLLAS